MRVTPIIEIGFGATAALQSLEGEEWFTVGHEEYGKIGVYPLAPSTIWVDVTAWQRGPLTISRQSSRLDAPRPSSCTIVLEDFDRLFDPDNIGSPFHGNLEPMRQVRIRAQTGTGTVAIWSGFILDWEQSVSETDKQYVTLPCTDALSLIANADLPELNQPSHGWERAGERIRRVLEHPAVRYTGPRDVADGSVRMAETVWGVPAWKHITDAAFSELGHLWVDRSGALKFRGRYETVGPKQAPTTVFAGDDEIAYALVPETYLHPEETLHPDDGSIGPRRMLCHDLDRTARRLINRATVSHGDGDEVTVSDEPSIDRYGMQPLSADAVSGKADARALARHLVGRYADSSQQFSRLTIKVDDRRLTEEQVADAISFDITDRAQVRRMFPVGSPRVVERPVTVEGVTHTIGEGFWTVDLDLGDADVTDYFRIGDPVGVKPLAY